jgi:nitrite reductase (NADH) small subunit
MAEVFVARLDELPEGGRAFVASGGKQIGVIRAKGKLHAFLNTCPHQGGPICEGLMIHKVEEIIAADKTYQGMRFNENELHIVCPWHGWEFNVESGRCAGDGLHGLRRFQTLHAMMASLSLSEPPLTSQASELAQELMALVENGRAIEFPQAAARADGGANCLTRRPVCRRLPGVTARR